VYPGGNDIILTVSFYVYRSEFSSKKNYEKPFG
jgi:hypothetical protein